MIQQAKGQPISFELFSTKSFGKYIGNLVLSFAELHNNMSLFYIVSQKMVTYIDVLCPFMVNRVLRHVHSTSIVAPDGNTAHVYPKVQQLLFDPQYLSTT